MSFSAGMYPYIFRRKMEKTRSMKEEMDGKVFIFPPKLAFLLSKNYD